MSNNPRLYTSIVIIRVPKTSGLEDIFNDLHIVWAYSKEEAMEKSLKSALESHPTGRVSDIAIDDITEFANNPPGARHHD